MDTSRIQQLVTHVESLKRKGSFVIVKSIDGSYNHMGATVADAVLQANMRYKTHVEPRVEKIRDYYPEATTTSAVLAQLKKMPTTVFLDWKGQDRADRFDAIIRLFKSENIETEDDLKLIFAADHNGNFKEKLLSIRGIGPKTVDYFKILIGLPTSAIDRHLLNFLEEADIHVSNYNEAQEIIDGTADHLQADRAIFDHSIWHYMSDRSNNPPLKSCNRD